MTIDERIEEKGFWYDSSDICCVDYTSVVELIEEQRKIDIDDACEAYRKELSEIINIFNRLGKELYNIDELGELISLEGSVKDFRKAMEG